MAGDCSETTGQAMCCKNMRPALALVWLLATFGIFTAPANAWTVDYKMTPLKSVSTTSRFRESRETKRLHSHGAIQPKVVPLHLNLLASAASQLFTDGVHVIAYETVAGSTRLIDTKTGKVVNRMDPSGCSYGLSALGGGQLLYRCADPGCPQQESFCGLPGESEPTSYGMAHYVVVNVATGFSQELAGTNHVPLMQSRYNVQGEFLLDGIGAQWALVEKFGTPLTSFSFLDWHTGRELDQYQESSRARHEVENLNRTGLLEPLCTPLQRIESHELVPQQRFLSIYYAAPFAVQVGELPPPENIHNGNSISHFQLRRCGSMRQEVLPQGLNSTSGVRSVQLAGGVLSWVGTDPRNEEETNAMYLTVLRAHGRKWHGTIYKPLGPAIGERHILVQHTTNVFYESVEESSSQIAPVFRIYARRIP